MACQERDDAQQWINHLEGQLQGEKDLKVVAKGMSTGLAMEVDQCQEEVKCLKTKVTQQHDEVRWLQADVKW